MNEDHLAPIHPGEVLAEEFLAPLNMSQYKLAQLLGVDPRRIHAIVHGQRAISADTALRLSRLLGTSPQFWINLQSRYDLDLAANKAAGLDAIRPLPQPLIDLTAAS